METGAKTPSIAFIRSVSNEFLVSVASLFSDQAIDYSNYDETIKLLSEFSDENLNKMALMLEAMANNESFKE